jgi:hypothetical protein
MIQKRSTSRGCFGKASLVLVTLLTLSLCFFATAGYKASAADTNWVTLNSIQDLTDHVTLQSGQALISNHAYNVTFAVDVPFTQTQSTFVVSLQSQMIQSGTQFWYRLSDYNGYDPNGFTAGLKSISFNQVQGHLVLSVLFLVPADYTVTQAGSLSLHAIKNNVNVVTVQVTGGATVGTFSNNFSDEMIQRYLTTYSQKSTYLSQGKIDSAYSNVVNGILSEAQAIYTIGLPDSALAVLNNVDPGNFPAAPSNTMTLLLVVVVVVIAIIAALFAVMFLRAKSRVSSSNDVVNEVQKELAALEVSAVQFDKKLADKISELKNRLGEVFE